jgi:Tol biopolymer transport system component
VAAVHDAVLNRTPAPGRQLNPELPVRLDEIIHKAMEKDRERRYQAASEMLEDLKSVAAGLPVQNTGPRFVSGRPYGMPLRRSSWVAGSIALLMVAAAAFRLGNRQPPSQPDLKQLQLTTNSNENSVVDGAISPDGKYLAYADKNAIHIRQIETGETRTIPEPEALKGTPVDWSPGPWFPDSTRFFSTASMPNRRPSIWAVSLLGGAPRKLRDDASAWSISPDGSLVAFTTRTGRAGNREIWLMRSDGEQARKLYETDENSSFERVEWSPDGRRLAYIKQYPISDKSESVLESRDLNGGPPTTISSPAPWDFWWLTDGRMAFSLVESHPGAFRCNFWELRIDTLTGKPSGKPRRLTGLDSAWTI